MHMTPGRVAALVLGVPVALSLIGWTGFNIVALAGKGSYPVSFTIPVRDGQVTAQIGGGNVDLRQQGTGAVARLTGTVHYSLFRPAVTADVTATSTIFGFDCDNEPAGNCGLDANLDVPVSTAVSLSTGGGDMSVSNFTGNLTLSTEGGDLTTGNLGGDLQLNTGGGDLNSSALDGNLQVTADGGDVSANAVAAPTATVDSGGGDVTLTFTQVPKNLDITSDGGDIYVILPAGAARYSITANAEGGDISTVPSTASAGNTIVANSGGGDITIIQAS
jgi:Putative adhesin